MDGTVTIDALWLSFLIGTVLPALTALVTKRWSHKGTKALVLLALSTLAGGFATIGADGHPGHLHPETFLLGLGAAYITAVSTHYGLLKPTGVTGDEGLILRKVPAGLGRASSERGQHASTGRKPDTHREGDHYAGPA
jgi:peptidoglycan/LPS O-acetylase OafA/YrhL